MRALGLDIGDKRIGVALSDASGLIAQPLEVFERDPRTSPYQHIVELAQTNDVETIVVGMPVSMNAGESGQTRSVREFVRGLKKRLPHDIRVEIQDERLSSAAGERALLEADMRRADRRQTRDKVAAAIILQAWLDAQSENPAKPNGI